MPLGVRVEGRGAQIPGAPGYIEDVREAGGVSVKSRGNRYDLENDVGASCKNEESLIGLVFLESVESRLVPDPGNENAVDFRKLEGLARIELDAETVSGVHAHGETDDGVVRMAGFVVIVILSVKKT